MDHPADRDAPEVSPGHAGEGPPVAELLAMGVGEQRSVHPLAGDVTRVGRSAENHIVLRDVTVSRFHAQFERRKDGFTIRDLGSTSGTFVNGVRCAKDQRLRDNDRIHIGRVEFVFRLKRAAAPESVEAPPRAGLLDKTIAFSVPTTRRATAEDLSKRRFEMLSRVADAIHSVADPDELLRALMDVLFEIFHPDRGVILLREGPEGAMVEKIKRPGDGELKISHTIVNHAVENQMSLLVTDAAEDERFRQARSVQQASIQAAICCPLVSKEKILGALYLDAQVNLFTYEEEDLVLLNLVAANAAMAIENAILIQEKRERLRLARGEPGPIIAESPAMRVVEERIRQLARTRCPVLIEGAAGTGKRFAAKALHVAAGVEDAPFIAVDCADVAAEEGGEILFGTAPAGGGEPGGGAFQLAEGGTLVLAHVSALDLESQEVLARRLEALSGEEATSRGPRLIATTMEDLKELARAGRFFAPLAERLSTDTIRMPRLLERKEDILPLARHFLSRCEARSHEYGERLNPSAERALLALRYKRNNVAELKEAVEFAALMSGGVEIGAEHIFTGPTGKDDRLEYDLERSPLLRWFVRSPAAELAQVGVLAFFSALALVCLAAGDTVLGRVANGLVWGLWWPALMVMFLLMGRLWCRFCPISKAGRIAQRVLCLDRPAAAWMKESSGWIMGFLFFAIIWSEGVFAMPHAPAATGILLLALMGFAVVLGVLHRRDVWCRYLCPLGALGAGYSVPSMLQVHANQRICSTQCKTHDCFKGSEGREGCPMFHHPLYVRDAHFCKLCFTCLRTCPHDSAKPFLSFALRGIWRVGDLGPALVPFASIVFFLTIAMLVSHKGILGSDAALGFTLISLAAAALGIGTNFALPRLLSRDRDPTVAARVSFAMLVLAWGPFMAFHLENIPGLEAVAVGAAPGSFWNQYLGLAEVSFLAILQVASIGLAALLAAIALWNVRATFVRQGGEDLPLGWAVLAGLCAAHLSAALAIVCLGGSSL